MATDRSSGRSEDGPAGVGLESNRADLLVVLAKVQDEELRETTAKGPPW